MTRSSVFFFTVSLLLLLVAASATALAGNVTSGLRYDGCAPGDTVGECIAAAGEEVEGVEAVVHRILQGEKRYLTPPVLGRQPFCDPKRYSDCIGTAQQKKTPCPMYQRCGRATG